MECLNACCFGWLGSGDGVNAGFECQAGLAADSMVFEDEVLESVGPQPWLDYMQV